MTKIYAMLIVIGTFFMASCGDKSEKFEGTYYSENGEYSIAFSQNKKAYVTVPFLTTGGDYEIDGDKIILKTPNMNMIFTKLDYACLRGEIPTGAKDFCNYQDTVVGRYRATGPEGEAEVVLNSDKSGSFFALSENGEKEFVNLTYTIEGKVITCFMVDEEGERHLINEKFNIIDIDTLEFNEHFFKRAK